jgi:hypothetical protein
MRTRSIGLGLIGLVAVVVIGLSGNLDTAWGLIIAGIAVGLAVLDELSARRPLYAGGYTIGIVAAVVGFYIWDPWGVLIGAGVGILAISYIINTRGG